MKHYCLCQEKKQNKLVSWLLAFIQFSLIFASKSYEEILKGTPISLALALFTIITPGSLSVATLTSLV